MHCIFCPQDCKIPSPILQKTHATQLCSNRKTTFPTQYSWAKKCSLCSDWDCLRSGLGWAEVWSMTGQIRALFKFFLHSFFTAAADIETQCEPGQSCQQVDWSVTAPLALLHLTCITGKPLPPYILSTPSCVLSPSSQAVKAWAVLVCSAVAVYLSLLPRVWWLILVDCLCCYLFRFRYLLNMLVTEWLDWK